MEAIVKLELTGIAFSSHDLPGRLVAVDGSDGTGKTTLLDGLEEYLKSEGIAYLRTRQPTTEARNLDAFRTYLFAPERRDEVDYRGLLCMMIGDRLQHAHQVIKPALRDGLVVLCDRYIYTQIVTTRTRGHDDEPWMYELYRHVLNPDLGIITDSPLDVTCARISGRADWHESFLESDHVERNLFAYREVAKAFDLELVDTHTNGVEQVLSHVVNRLRTMLPAG